MKMRLAAAAATMCIASLSHPGAANAATLTYSHLSASAPDSFSLQLFDTNLGTLTGVQLGLSVTGDAIPEVVNPSYFFGPGTPA